MAEHKKTIVTEYLIKCRHCGSKDVSKYGSYKTIQYYICKTCNTKFAEIDSYPDMKYPKVYIDRALTYYYGGMSLRGIQSTFRSLMSADIVPSTIWRWILKYSRIVNEFTLDLRPKLSEVWIADETMIGIWGQNWWYWDIIDTETRFLVASHLSRTRTELDSTRLFQMARLRSKTRPAAIITDKLGQYNRAFSKVFYTRTLANKVYHLKTEGFTEPTNTNLIERFHGTLKQRTKVMRDLKEQTSARIILDGFVNHYNFFMKHDLTLKSS